MLNITSQNEGNDYTIFLEGRLDVRSAVDADREFARISEAADNVVLDCEKLEYVASAGLRAIKRLRLNMKAKNSRLVVRHVTAEVMDVFNMTGFSAMLTIE